MEADLNLMYIHSVNMIWLERTIQPTHTSDLSTILSSEI